jgi:hypothetical protein
MNFRSRSLRVHKLLHDVPLEDAWAIPLSGGSAGRTIQDMRAVLVAGREAAPAVVKGLFRLRRRIGSLFGGITNVQRTTLNPTRPSAVWSSIRPSFEKCSVRGPNVVAERAMARVGRQWSRGHRPEQAFYYSYPNQAYVR